MKPAEPQLDSLKRLLLLLLLLALPPAIALVLNVPTVTDTFQGDDAGFVVRHRQNGVDFLWRAFGELHIGAYYRPVADLAFFLQQKAFDDAAPSWHLVSVLLHAATVLALALAVLALTRRPLTAWVAAALFALTPAYGGGVAWVANQTEILAGLFASLTLALFVLAIRDRLRPALLLGAVAAYGLACGAKEVGAAALAPVAVYAVLHAWERGLRPGLARGRDLAAAAAPLLPFLAVVGLWGAVQAYVRLVVRPPLLPFYHLGPHALDTVRYYALRLVLPVNSGYQSVGALEDPVFGIDRPLGYLSAAAVFGLCLLALVRGTTPMRALAVWLLAALAPISLWEPFFTSARYTYTPALAFSGLVAAAAVPLAERLLRRPRLAALVAAGALALLAVPYSIGTLQQNQRTVRQGKHETAFLRQLEALDLAVPEGATIYLVDTPWNDFFSPAEPMAQMLYGPSIRVVKVAQEDVDLARREAQEPAVFLGMNGDRLVIQPGPTDRAGR